MTQRFVDYLKQNPRRTSNQFYEDVLGYSRPRAHNNMFFSSIKDAGIVKMERQGRQFVYSLGPNYQALGRRKIIKNLIWEQIITTQLLFQIAQEDLGVSL